MSTLFLPRITAADHDILSNFIHNYPADSYDKWLYLQTKEAAEWEGSGGKVVFVDLSADDFINYARQTGARADVHLLKAVAFAKGKHCCPARN
jgi:hypothetical protein